VTTAIRLMLGQAILSAASLIALLAQLAESKRLLRERVPAPTAQSVDTAVTISAGSYVAFLALYVLLTRQVAKGRNWARIVVWVLVGLGLLAGLSALGQPEPGVRRVLHILTFPVELGIALLLALSPSNRWFRPRL